MRISNAGAVVIVLGILIMVGAVMLFLFGPGGWEKIVGAIVLFIIGLGSAVGGSEMK